MCGDFIFACNVCLLYLMVIRIFFHTSFRCMYRLSIQIQISLMTGNLYMADLITGAYKKKALNQKKR